MDAAMRQHSLALLTDMPFNRLGHIAIPGGGKPVAHQRARFTVGAEQRSRTAGLIEQVPDLAKMVHAVLAQQRVHVRGRQAGPGKLTIL